MAAPNAQISSEQIADALARLSKVFDADQLLTGEAECMAYGTDSSRQMHPPVAVVLPDSEEQVADAVKIARITKVPVIARGRGTATTGASLAEVGGFVLATDRLNSVCSINSSSRSATVQPGVLNRQLQQAASEHGLFWPPDPSSAAYCSVGGNLATAAAGPRGVKYGGVRENVLGLRAVAGTGELITSGSAAAKCSAGYDLARLIVGSEGTLAIITEAVVRLVSKPGATSGIVACFSKDDAALKAAGMLMQRSAMPAQLEFIDSACVALLDQAGLPAQAKALLMIQYDAEDDAQAQASATAAASALADAGCISADIRQPDELRAQRKVLSQRLPTIAPVKINEDVSVPVDKLSDLVNHARAAAKEADVLCAIFGHAGAGNLHVNLMLPDESQAVLERAEKALEKIFSYVTECGGAISGEHGIGIAKRRFMHLQANKASIRMMHALKHAFDPDGILNPGKVLPATG